MRHRAKLNPDVFNPTVIGISPLGNNQKDQTEFPNTQPVVPGQREVPLVYDSVSGTYCSPLDKVNMEERLAGLEVARLTNDDQRFLGAAGFVNGPTDPTTTQV